ncbi:MAG: UDP-N-acetylmuramoyl-L-alanyl-D-glutamate--2,6-diaminopimelate ligase [Candidatus Omnitrophica bacterium]|nr:UDP-N-acetylmuramoyl-L-alanyl-D-glutamate--2,6-diaminopimelate ligase [Candidatus Omnitrophota bacterium]
MRLNELIKILDLNFPPPNVVQDLSVANDFLLRGITSDSRQVSRDYIFVAVTGNKLDGSQFIDEAIKNGARVIISEDRRQKTEDRRDVTFINVKDSRLALAQLAARFYGYPSRKMKVVGITGTNGKTTVTYLIEHILKQAGYKTGLIGTINYRFDGNIIAAVNTTPGPEYLQSLLAQMYNKDIRYCVMEVSSHALSQARVAEIDFSAAIFTNLSQDHLDYHKDMEEYFQAKSLLFRNLNSTALAIINKDSPYAQRIINLTHSTVTTYSLKQSADIFASGIKLTPEGTSFTLVAAGKKLDIRTALIGRHNVYNILAAVGFALQEGISLEMIKKAIESFVFVPGRLEKIDLGQRFKVFVDYAHTEDALRNVILSLRELRPQRIIVVFGCGGERDKTKRPKMGYVASELAESVIITSDNPRSEDENDIAQDIRKGIKRNNYKIILDRREAINEALRMAEDNDIVLIAGKGHENYQIFKDKIIDFNDRKEVEKCLMSMIS